MSSLSIRSLVKRFQSVTALRSIDLDIGEREFVSLLGPSGCGKTTTLRCVAGFEYPDDGKVLFGGRDITWLLPEQRNMGMVFQSYALFPHMTVWENLSFGLEMRRIGLEERKRRIADLLEMVQLGSMAERFPRQLSGGQQQRVALARALVIEPDLLLLDEPLANLDAILRDEMRFFIRGLQQRVGITAVYVTHDQSEAMVMSDRIVVMFDGEIAQIGTPRQIYTEPASRRVASFIGRSNFLSGTVAGREQADGIHAIETPVGRVLGRAREPLAAGTAVSMLMRPEAITLGGREGWNRLEGTATKSVYVGNGLDLFVRLDDGTEIEVTAKPDLSFGPGERLSLGVPPAQCWILPR